MNCATEEVGSPKSLGTSAYFWRASGKTTPLLSHERRWAQQLVSFMISEIADW